MKIEDDTVVGANWVAPVHGGVGLVVVVFGLLERARVIHVEVVFALAQEERVGDASLRWLYLLWNTYSTAQRLLGVGELVHRQSTQ